MAKGKVRKGKSESKKEERLTRKQRRAMEKSIANVDPEDLDAQLKSLGLCTKNIAGDGNCLFRSLSDQYYGNDGNHKAIRQEICQYLRDNEETYKFFVEDDQSFEHHVQCMSQNATFGGNMELVAFAKLKQIDIKVYQPGLIYVINGVEEEDDEERQVLHIAYHSWEHYSSVRNIDGPYSGPPEININTDKAKDEENDNEEDDNEDDNLNSKEKAVLNSCPNTNIRKIRRLLLKFKGDPDKVIDAIYESENKVSEEGNDTIQEKDESIQTEQNVSVEAESDEKPVDNEKSTDEGSPADNKKPTDEGKLIDEENPTDDEKLIVEPNVPPSPPPTDEVEKPKKLSAAERKKEAKKRQKENKLMKERAKAARKAKYKQEKTDNNQESSDPAITVTQSMKEMYI